MNGVLIISTKTGACLYSKGDKCQERKSSLGHVEGISIASILYVLNLQASAAFSNNQIKPEAPFSKSCLKSFLTKSGLLQFAAHDAYDILACVSLSKTLRGAPAELLCQEVLNLFVSKYSAMLASGSLTSPARGFTACLHSLYQQLPQRLAQAMACNLAPMQVLWAIAGPVEAFTRAEGTGQAPSCWPCCKRPASVAPQQPAHSYQVLLTDAKAPSSHVPGSMHATLPGTHLTVAEIEQMIAKAAKRLTKPSSGPDTYVHDLIPTLRSIAVPLELHRGSAPAYAIEQAAAVPAVAEHTPRMVKLSLIDDAAADQPSQSHQDASALGLQHFLLVMHQDDYVVALPVELGGQITHAQQAKSLIAHETKQLIEVLQSVNSIVRMQTTVAADV